jgi:hypothetical protein
VVGNAYCGFMFIKSPPLRASFANRRAVAWDGPPYFCKRIHHHPVRAKAGLKQLLAQAVSQGVKRA